MTFNSYSLHCTAQHCTALHCTVQKKFKKCWGESQKKCQKGQFYCIGATIRTHGESQCLPYAGFFYLLMKIWHIANKTKGLLDFTKKDKAWNLGTLL